ncbi:sodium:solute symporter family protein [Barnesiella viscericola]|uniref:sodium:solute symporter family protein n=1 Tax=Barnesiella viscericola TaxID=397865 RepID=UPI0024B68531|nr:sodium:solute symporter family protein [Barnesiella viscericola]
MHLLDFITILIFATIVLITGISFAKAGGKDMKSFFAAGGAVPWWINGLSLFMGFFSAGTFVVWGSIAYTHGMVSLMIQWTMAIAGLIVGFYIAPKWQRTHTITVAEYITLRLGAKVQKIYTYLFLFISLFTTGSFLYPVAKLVSVATDFDLYLCILLLGAVSIIYVAIGGLWAVVVTDVLQFIILTAAVVIVVPLAFGKIGGVEAFFTGVPEGFFNLVSGEYTWPFILSFGIYNLFFLGGNWAYVQRYTSVKTERDAKKVGWLFGVLYIISPILWMLPPMIYRVYNPALSGFADEGAYLMMCKAALPIGMLGMILGGMIFATASSLNATLNISSGVFTNDIYKYLRPKSSNKELIKVARLSTIGFGILAVVVALLIPSMGGIVNVVISLGALTGVPLYFPVVWTLFSKRQTVKSVLLTTLICLGVNAIFKFITPLFGFSLDRTEETVLGVTLPIVMMLFFEIYYKTTGYVNPKYAEFEAIRKERETEIEQAPEEETRSNKTNNYSLRVMGRAIVAASVLILIIGGISATGKYIILPLGIILLGLGLKLMLKKI